MKRVLCGFVFVFVSSRPAVGSAMADEALYEFLHSELVGYVTEKSARENKVIIKFVCLCYFVKYSDLVSGDVIT